MVKVRALVPLEDEEGVIAQGEVVDVSDEQAADWRANGKVSLIADEEAAEKMASEGGHFSDVTGREEVEPLEPEDADDPIPPAKKKGK